MDDLKVSYYRFKSNGEKETWGEATYTRKSSSSVQKAARDILGAVYGSYSTCTSKMIKALRTCEIGVPVNVFDDLYVLVEEVN